MVLRPKPKPEPCYECDPHKGHYWGCPGCRLLWKEQDLATVPERERKPSKRAKTRVNPVSARRRKEMVAYKERRIEFLMWHRRCEIGPHLTEDEDWECLGGSTQVHHVVNRSQARALITDFRNFCAVCRECHEQITTNPSWARVNHWTFSSLRLPEYIQLEYRTEDGRTMVLLDECDPLAVAMMGERVVPELFVLAWAARLVDHDSDPNRVKPRNRESGDARLCNIKPEKWMKGPGNNGPSGVTFAR